MYIKRMQKRYYLLVLAFVIWALGLGISTAAVDHGLLAQAQAQLTAGKPESALKLLQAQQLKYAGNPAFDELLGKSALAADQATVAILAFERCLLVQTKNKACAIGITQAHLSLNELQNAKTILAQDLLDKNSKSYQNLLEQYQRQILGEPKSHDSRFSLWMQAGLGYDNNVNTATTADSVFFPSSDTTVLLNNASKRQDSFFHQLKLGLNYSTYLSENWRFVADGILQTRNNWSMHNYDSAVAETRIGVERRNKGHRLNLKLIGQYFNFDGYNYRNTYGGLAQYAYAVSDTTELGSFVQYSYIQYPHQNERNASRLLGGFTWSQQLLQGKALMYGNVYLGREKAIKSYAPDYYDYDITGIKLGGAWLVTPRMRLEAFASVENRAYDGEHILFEQKRSDTQFDASLGAVYAINRKFSIRPSYQYTKNNSSFVLRDYSKHVFMLNFRYAIF